MLAPTGLNWYGTTVESTLTNSSSFECALLLRENSKEEEVSPEKSLASRSLSNRYSLYYGNFRSCDDVVRKPHAKPETRWRPTVKTNFDERFFATAKVCRVFLSKY